MRLKRENFDEEDLQNSELFKIASDDDMGEIGEDDDFEESVYSSYNEKHEKVANSFRTGESGRTGILCRGDNSFHKSNSNTSGNRGKMSDLISLGREKQFEIKNEEKNRNSETIKKSTPNGTSTNTSGNSHSIIQKDAKNTQGGKIQESGGNKMQKKSNSTHNSKMGNENGQSDLESANYKIVVIEKKDTRRKNKYLPRPLKGDDYDQRRELHKNQDKNLNQNEGENGENDFEVEDLSLSSSLKDNKEEDAQFFNSSGKCSTVKLKKNGVGNASSSQSVGDDTLLKNSEMADEKVEMPQSQLSKVQQFQKQS